MKYAERNTDGTLLIDELGRQAAKILASPEAAALRGKSIAPSGSAALVDIANEAARRARQQTSRRGIDGVVAKRTANQQAFHVAYLLAEASDVSHTERVKRAADKIGVSESSGKRYAKLLGLKGQSRVKNLKNTRVKAPV
jgi:hypothetical protein